MVDELLASPHSKPESLQPDAKHEVPLPTCSRLSQIISGVPCEYGYNEVALKTIETFFQDKPDVEKLGTLVLDEIKLRASVDFNNTDVNRLWCNFLTGILVAVLSHTAVILRFIFSGWLRFDQLRSLPAVTQHGKANATEDCSQAHGIPRKSGETGKNGCPTNNAG